MTQRQHSPTQRILLNLLWDTSRKSHFRWPPIKLRCWMKVIWLKLAYLRSSSSIEHVSGRLGRLIFSDVSIETRVDSFSEFVWANSISWSKIHCQRSSCDASWGCFQLESFDAQWCFHSSTIANSNRPSRHCLTQRGLQAHKFFAVVGEFCPPIPSGTALGTETSMVDFIHGRLHPRIFFSVGKELNVLGRFLFTALLIKALVCLGDDSCRHCHSRLINNLSDVHLRAIRLITGKNCVIDGFFGIFCDCPLNFTYCEWKKFIWCH